MSTRLVEDPGWRRAVAGADPRALVWQPRFWRGQLPLGTILLGSAVLLRVLAPYTYSWSDGWSGYLSVAVQLLAVWGVVICVQGLATLDVDTALAAEMEARGSEYLVSLRSGTRARVDLDEAERTIAPSNPASPTPAPVRLFQQIIKEARDRRFESGGILTQPYREEALEDIFRLQNLQKIALWLGILGTFVGLLVALQRADLGTTSDPEGLARMVQEMYGGLFISFTASVAGLEVAIILGFLLLVVRKRQERYFAVLESAVVTLLSVARHAVNRDDFLAEFSQVNAAMRELSGRVYEQTQETSEGLQGVHRRLEAQNARIDTGLAKLVETRGEFDGFLRQIGETEREFIADLRRVFHAASFKDFGAAIEAGVRQAGHDVSRRLEEVTAQGVMQAEAVNAAARAMEDALQAQSSVLAEAVNGLATRLAAVAAEHAGAAQTVEGALQAQSRQLAAAVEGVATRLATVSAEHAAAVQQAYRRLEVDAARHQAGAQEVTARFNELSAHLITLNRSIERLSARTRRPGRDFGNLLSSLALRWRRPRHGGVHRSDWR